MNKHKKVLLILMWLVLAGCQQNQPKDEIEKKLPQEAVILTEQDEDVMNYKIVAEGNHLLTIRMYELNHEKSDEWALLSAMQSITMSDKEIIEFLNMFDAHLGNQGHLKVAVQKTTMTAMSSIYDGYTDYYPCIMLWNHTPKFLIDEEILLAYQVVSDEFMEITRFDDGTIESYRWLEENYESLNFTNQYMDDPSLLEYDALAVTLQIHH